MPKLAGLHSQASAEPLTFSPLSYALLSFERGAQCPFIFPHIGRPENKKRKKKNVKTCKEYSEKSLL